MYSIVNQKRYWNASYQICWVLKESNSGDGSFHVQRWVDTYLPVDKKVPRRIALSSYGILQGAEDAEDLDAYDDEVKASLRDIAWINIGEHPGGSSTSWSRLEMLYAQNRIRVLAEMEAAKPDIVIFGGTCSLLWNDLVGGYFSYHLQHLHFHDESLDERAYQDADDEGPLFLEMPHPGVRKWRDQEYASRIIRMVRAWERGAYDLETEW